MIAADAMLDGIYLVEITALPPGAGSTAGDPDFGARVFGEAGELDDIEAGEVVLRYSSAPYETRPGDTPSSQPYRPCATVALALSRSVPLSPGAGGIVALQVGEIELNNADGALDPIVESYAVDGRDVTVRLVPRDGAYADAVLLFRGTASGWLYGDRTSVKLGMHGVALLLDQPLQGKVYAGTGGKEGGVDIKGLRVPLNYGPIDRFSPPCTDTVLLMYQLNDGPIQAVIAARDGDAASIALGTDYASHADLAAAATAEGTMDTCLADGFVRLGSKPNFNLTVDFEGDKSGGVYRTATADIGRHFIEARLGLGDSRTDGDAFDALAALQPAVVCYSLGTDAKNASDALAELFGGIGAFVADTIDGKFTCARLDAPDPAAAMEIPAEAIGGDGLQAIALPDDIDPGAWRIGCAWGRNWTVQTSNLAGSVLEDLDRVSYLAKAYRIELFAAGAVLLTHPTAKDHAEVPSLFAEQADAAAEAARLGALYAPGRKCFAVPLQAVSLQAELGASVRLFYDRFSLSAGKPALVFEQIFASDSKSLQLSVFL